MSFLRGVMLLVCFCAACKEPVRAQGSYVRLQAGGIVPVGSMGRTYDLGPAAALSVHKPIGTGGFSWSLALWGARFVTVVHSDFTAFSILGSVHYAVIDEPIRPYVLVGAGGHLQIRDAQRNPYGWVPGLQAGLGLSWTVARLEMHVEIQRQLILSDLVSGCDFCLATQTPIMLGIAIPF